MTVLSTVDDTREFGRRLGRMLRAGDLVVLTGPLGAGKTALVQGIGAGMAVLGNVTSPTFVIARVHPSLTGGPALVHVDAYRLGGIAELDDLDLDASLDDAVTVVEWGHGLAESLAPDRLDIVITRGDDDIDETRDLRITPAGPRWAEAGVHLTSPPIPVPTASSSSAPAEPEQAAATPAGGSESARS
jgi:tRNA threonylcarbamoyladenosine biosynthesis protein TsaE